MKLAHFLSELGSEKGAPGGGAAAALTGSVGAALIEMTARLNDKRLGRSSGTAKKAAALRLEMQTLIAEDAKAFGYIQKIYRQRKEKPAIWQSALKKASQPPLAVCKAAAVAAELARRERVRTSAWLESDRREALVLLEAAFRSAVLNVEVNLRLIENSAYQSKIRRHIRLLRRHVR